MSGPHTEKDGAGFKQGQTVEVASRQSLGHCRTPFYLRGHRGVVIGLAGTYSDPERLAYHKPGLPRRNLYRVRFTQSGLWENYHGPPADCLDADIFEHWLEPVTEDATT